MSKSVFLFCGLVIVMFMAGCYSTEPVADAAVEEESQAVEPCLPTDKPSAIPDSPSADGSQCEVPSTVLSSVRDVYAVLAPEIEEGLVVIDRDIILDYGHIWFTFVAGGNDYEFFGYVDDGHFYVRAAVCPCCGETGLSHGGTCLSCHSCGTTFGLVDSGGEECGFPVGEVPYDEGERYVTMLLDDLVEAYERTAAGEVELFEPEPEPIEKEADDTSWPRCCRR